MVLFGRFRRIVQFLGEVKELGPVKADAFSPVLQGLIDIVGLFDVRLKADLVAVGGDGREDGQGEQRHLGVVYLLHPPAVIGKLVGVGVDNDQPAGAVDDDGVAAADLVGDVPQADDGGDFQVAGDDRGVAGPAADVG